MSTPGRFDFRVRDYRRDATNPVQSSHHVSSFNPAISSTRHTRELAAQHDAAPDPFRATIQATDVQPSGSRNPERARDEPAQRVVPVTYHRNRRIQYRSSDTSHYAVDNTIINDPANAVRPRDFRENPYLGKDLYMLQRFNINALPRVNNNFINDTQNSTSLDIVTKSNMLTLMRNINKIKDYNEHIGSDTCIDACKSIVDIHGALHTLNNIPGMGLPDTLKRALVSLNRIEHDYDTRQQAQQPRAALR